MICAEVPDWENALRLFYLCSVDDSGQSSSENTPRIPVDLTCWFIARPCRFAGLWTRMKVFSGYDLVSGCCKVFVLVGQRSGLTTSSVVVVAVRRDRHSGLVT